jgi:hypothetical protein
MRLSTALLVLAAISLQTTVSATSAEVTRVTTKGGWVGIAAAPDKRVFRDTASTVDAARSQAGSECEAATHLDCDVIAVPNDIDEWSVVAINCTASGKPAASFVAGSDDDKEEQIAQDKAGKAGYSPDSCATIYRE